MKNDLLRFFESDLIQKATINGELWFSAKDVCAMFGVKDYMRATEHLKDEEKAIVPGTMNGGPGKTLFINEPGLYRLLFLG